MTYDQLLPICSQHLSKLVYDIMQDGPREIKIRWVLGSKCERSLNAFDKAYKPCAKPTSLAVVMGSAEWAELMAD